MPRTPAAIKPTLILSLAPSADWTAGAAVKAAPAVVSTNPLRERS